MKVLFVNPPFVRYSTANGKDPLEISRVMFHPIYRKYPIIMKIWNKFREKDLRFGARAGSRWPWTSNDPIAPLHYPFIMAYSVSYLRSHNIEADLIDAVAQEKYSYKKFLNDVIKHNPDIVVIETSTPTFDIDIALAEKISKFAEVALAGPHLTFYAKMNQEKYPFVKYLLKGEYIKSSLRMIQTRKKGIYESDFVQDLDSIPYPYRDYPEATKYFDFTMPTEQPQLQIYGSKGCPFKCTFCLWPQTMYMRKVALRTPEKVAKEIKYCLKEYGYKSIFFDDDTFNIGYERISKLCDELKKIGFPWTMMGRLDCSPDWLFDKMVDSGCVGMRFGVETFTVDIMKNIGKALDRIDYKKALRRLTKKYPKLMLRIFMMKSLPGQTQKMHENDIKIAESMGFLKEGNIYRQIQISNCAPFPGTKMFDDLLKDRGEKMLNFDYSLYDGNRQTVMSSLSTV